MHVRARPSTRAGTPHHSKPQALARRVRVALFGAILRQDIGWFDRDENSSGRLATLLSTDAAYVRGAVGDVFGGCCCGGGVFMYYMCAHAHAAARSGRRPAGWTRIASSHAGRVRPHSLCLRPHTLCHHARLYPPRSQPSPGPLHSPGATIQNLAVLGVGYVIAVRGCPHFECA